MLSIAVVFRDAVGKAESMPVLRKHYAIMSKLLYVRKKNLYFIHTVQDRISKVDTICSIIIIFLKCAYLSEA